MKINGAFDQALLGIQRGMDGMRKNATEIASAGQMKADDPTDIAKSMVEMVQNRQQVIASAKVLKATDEAIGTLFDEKA